MEGPGKWLEFVHSESEHFMKSKESAQRQIGTALVSLAVLIWALLELIWKVSPTTDDLAVVLYVFGIIGVVATIALLLILIFLARGVLGRKVAYVLGRKVDFTPKHQTEGLPGVASSLSILVGFFAVTILIPQKADTITAFIAVLFVFFSIVFGLLAHNAFSATTMTRPKGWELDHRLVTRLMKRLYALVVIVFLVMSVCLVGALLGRAHELLHVQTIEISLVLTGIVALVFFILTSLADVPKNAYMIEELRKLRMFLMSGMSDAEAEERLVELYGEFHWNVLKAEKEKGLVPAPKPPN